MAALRTDRHLAIALRKQGKSYSEINKELGIPESTMGYWFRGNPWSEEIKRNLILKAQVLARPKLRLMHRANMKKWDAWHQECRDEAVKEFPDLKNNILFASGLMLYWGEGDKVIKNGSVRLVNSDPAIIKIFYTFLNEVLKILKEKIYLRLTLYPELNDEAVKKYWSNILNIPLQQFKNSIRILGRHPNKRLSYGICSIGLHSRKLKEKIFTWIRLYQEYFSNNIAT